MIITAIATLITMSLLTSCEKIKGKGDVITESRSAETFNTVSLAMSATVYYTQDSLYSILISGQENIISQIQTQVEGSELLIRLKHGVILSNYEPIRIYITAPDVNGLDVSGSGDIFTEMPWVAGETTLNISGSGSINLAGISAENLTVNISGSGTIRAASGSVTLEKLKISGSGTIDLRSVEAGTVYSTTSGSGNTYVYAKDLLDVTISGSGNVWYYGTPAVNTHISGSGNLKRM